jgi:hypothetical protein
VVRLEAAREIVLVGPADRAADAGDGLVVAATVYVPAAGDGGETAYRVGSGTHSFTGPVPRF